MGLWFDSILVPSIVIGCEVDPKGFVGIDLIVQQKELRVVNRLNNGCQEEVGQLDGLWLYGRNSGLITYQRA